MPKGSARKSGGKAARSIRALKKKEPQLVEVDRHILALRGPSTSQLGVKALKDLVVLKKPDSKLFTRKNDVLPFEDASSLEFMCEKNDCTAFLYTSHNKKRPHNLVLGRTFDGHVLDMIEMGIVEGQGVEDIAGPKKMLAAKPLFLFQGDEWERHPTLAKLQSLLLDCFGTRSVTIPKLALPAIDHVISVTAVPAEGSATGSASGAAAWDGRILWRVYTVLLKRSGGTVPRVELLPHGPNLDWTIRRTQFAASDLEREARRQPAQLKVSKTKNISHDEFGETLGRLHMERQDFSSLQLRKSKGLKAERKGKAAKVKEGQAAGDEEKEQGGREEDERDAPAVDERGPRPKSYKPKGKAGHKRSRSERE